MRRIGVFGSGFNPPHIGHVVLAQEARWRLGLDRLIAVPTGNPPHKETGPRPGPQILLELARAAFPAGSGVEVSAFELEREGPSYTCDTLEAIATAHPEGELLLLLGADAAHGLADWHRLDRILELARIAVAPRGQIDPGRIEGTLAEAGGGDRFEVFPMPEIGISSSLVRSRVAAGEPFAHLVPAAVAGMIGERGLYDG